jgi:hypothetical protein
MQEETFSVKLSEHCVSRCLARYGYDVDPFRRNETLRKDCTWTRPGQNKLLSAGNHFWNNTKIKGELVALPAARAPRPKQSRRCGAATRATFQMRENGLPFSTGEPICHYSATLLSRGKQTGIFHSNRLLVHLCHTSDTFCLVTARLIRCALIKQNPMAMRVQTVVPLDAAGAIKLQLEIHVYPPACSPREAPRRR